MKVLYFDCVSGISGDMIIGALLDAGMPMNILKGGLAKLEIPGLEVSKRKVKRGELMGTKFEVKPSAVSHKRSAQRNFKEIIKLIDKSRLSEYIKNSAKKVFRNLADAEKNVHGFKGDDVHFHQLGEDDSIADIICACIGFDFFGIKKFYSSAVISGTGIIKGSHGPLPNPGPAALNLLKGIPLRLKDMPCELVTPTGAAILKTFCNGFGKAPAIKTKNIGYGAGDREYPGLPNLLRIIIGESI